MRYFYFLLVFIFCSNTLLSQSKMLRYPTVSDSDIAFSHAGDIYIVDVNGGTARKLTSHSGLEIFPRFSPDGKSIAFSAEYDGNREIYTIGINSKEVKRLSYQNDMGDLPERMGPDKICIQWTKDNKILYRSRANSWNPFTGQLFLVDTNASLPEQVPVIRGGFASYSDNGEKLAHNRIMREFRSWKNYQGGMADDIFIFDLKTKKSENITKNQYQDIIPMWHEDKIYYLSDRDGRMNIYSYNLDSKETKQISFYKDYDIKFPSFGNKHIVFEKAGEIYLMSLADEKINKVNINVPGDFPHSRSKIVNVKDQIRSYSLSREGKRALISAHGDIFTVSQEKAFTHKLTATPGVHERNPIWSPDGKWIAYISDQSGNDEVYIMKPDGKDKIQISNDTSSYKFSLKWSQNSRYLLCSDKSMNLYYYDITNKEKTIIYKSKNWEIRHFDFSPDSKWIAFTDESEEGLSYIILYSLENNFSINVSDNFFSSSNPIFSNDGKYLFFSSMRDFSPQLGSFELSYTYNDMERVYGITLQDTSLSPYYLNDQYAEIDSGNVKKRRKKKVEAEFTIDTLNIKDRIFALKHQAGNYRNLVYSDNSLYYIFSKKNQKAEMKKYDLSAQKEESLGNIWAFAISTDGKKKIYKKKDNLYIDKLSAKVKFEKALDLSNLETTVDKKEEWKQVFHEAWRQMRDFFYDPNMNGKDWLAIREKYSDLVQHVQHRDELTYLISEMIAELNTGHAYVGGGYKKEKARKVGLLAADFSLDSNSGYYRIDRIFKGRNWEEATRSPLTEPGIHVKEGEYLIAIDGIELSKENHPYKLLANKANKWVKIKTNTKPIPAGAKEWSILTKSSEAQIRYFNWVEERKRICDSLSDGKIAYVHIPDMSLRGLSEFVKNFYPQVRKKAMIIDDRFNGGGFVSRMIIERLRRTLSMSSAARNQEMVNTYPGAVFTGPMICLLNEYSASDGDIFSYQFKYHKLGLTLGKRSWGGIIGIRGSLPFLDNSYLFKPEYWNFSNKGEWILEGIGTKPDIEIENDPYLEFEGKDQQLEKAIELLLEELKLNDNEGIPKRPKR